MPTQQTSSTNPTPKFILSPFVLALLLCLFAGCAAQQSSNDAATSTSQQTTVAAPNTEPATPNSTAQNTSPPTSQTTASTTPQLPGITFDLQNKRILIEAEVCWKESDVCDWLELLACNPGTRDYESLFTTEALPSHVHLALLSLGLTPGSPQTIVQDPQTKKWQTIPPTGPILRIQIQFTDPDSAQTVTLSPSAFAKSRHTNKPFHTDTFLFTGSAFAQNLHGQEQYMADQSGNVISLVNFGDDLLSAPNAASSNEDHQQWIPSDALPPLGTPATIIISLPTDQSQSAQ
ncbi:YdjY domain-containing protein [Poriferisphaera sp. WC338]|uniref:YdjY domain-containing protein n=1 Tax=Poriferisphaera sp. WC338 TaxID=3425129 RepID=UPI003D81524D